MEFPQLVNSHPNQENYKFAFHVCRHSTMNNLRHMKPSQRIKGLVIYMINHIYDLADMMHLRYTFVNGGVDKMSLTHAILGFLNRQPMTGYDLKTQCFDISVAYFWPADQAQIYRT